MDSSAPLIGIIEDDLAIADMYKIKFETEGLRVVLADNGVNGLAMVEHNKPALILLDLMMPQMTGDEMLEKMRATDWGKDTRVIILTNVSMDEISPKVHSLGVEEFIVKAHTTPQQVVDTVKRLLGIQGAAAS